MCERVGVREGKQLPGILVPISQETYQIVLALASPRLHYMLEVLDVPSVYLFERCP